MAAATRTDHAPERLAFFSDAVSAMLAAAPLNLKAARIATGPHMVDPKTPPGTVGYVRARPTSVVPGSASAAALGLVGPQAAQAGLATIPPWPTVPTRGKKAAA